MNAKARCPDCNKHFAFDTSRVNGFSVTVGVPILGRPKPPDHFFPVCPRCGRAFQATAAAPRSKRPRS